MQFQRHIGFFGLLFIGIGSIIGSGWLFGPMYAAQIAGPAAIVSWILGGLLMALIALTFAELGSAFPMAGGLVQYAQQSHGPLISFMVGWMVWISSVAVAPVETLAIMQYAANYIPALMKKANNIPVLTPTGMISAAALMGVMSVLNYYGARFFSRSNNVITLAKLIVPITTLFLLLIMDFHSSHFTSPNTGGFTPFGWHGVLAALPLGGVVYSLIGANTILQLGAEIKNPQRDIPLALIGSILFCAALYAALQFAFVGALPSAALSEGWKHLHFSGDMGPFAGIFTALGLAWFVMILYADAILSPFGTGFIFTSATARVNYGLSKIGFFPAWFQQLAHRGVPARGIIVNYIVGLILLLPFPGWQSLVVFIISCFIISYMIGPIALVALRKSQPELNRPFRLPYQMLLSLLAFYACNLLVFWTGWQTVSKMMITILIGFIFFTIHCCRKKNQTWSQQWAASWWIAPYLAGLCGLSFLGDFGGGKGAISFGLDFLVIGLFTAIIFFLALFSVKKTIT